jgi:hypothetical protein
VIYEEKYSSNLLQYGLASVRGFVKFITIDNFIFSFIFGPTNLVYLIIRVIFCKYEFAIQK